VINSDAAQFPPEVIGEIGHYVYRLIDPRNGETFYIGKGQGNRVFAHVRGEASTDVDSLDAKSLRIWEIRNAGFSVQHVIHRHGLDEKTAYEVEGALLDAYSGTTNIAGGRGNGDRGAAHSRQIIERYTADSAEITHRAIEINVRVFSVDRDLYTATRFAWRVDKNRAEKAEIALAVMQGLIKGVYSIDRWLLATKENFPEFGDQGDVPGRYGFIGSEAVSEIQQRYKGKKFPPKAPGSAYPIRYHNL